MSVSAFGLPVMRLLGLALAATVSASGGAGGASPAAAPSTPQPPGPSDVWQSVAPGAERMNLMLDGDAVLLVRFDLDRFRAEVVVGKGSPPQRRTAADVRQGRGALAAVNGGFFDEHVVPLGLRIATGDQRYPLRPKADWGVLVLAGHRAHIVHTHDYGAAVTAAAPAPVDGAIQVGPRLIVEGQALKLRPQLARRTAVALDRDGQFLTLVVSPEPVEAGALAARLATLGFDSAVFLDGGPSTQLSLAVGDARAEVAGGYPVPDLLAIFGRPAARRSTSAAAPPVDRSQPAAKPAAESPARRP